MRVVIAPDSFKGSIDAASAASSIAAGWRCERPSDELILLPQADGGEGTLDAIFAAVPGSRFINAGLVPGPDGRATHGDWLLMPDGSGVVELARVSGLPLMARPSPLTASTRGLGAVMASALDAGVSSLTICLGGSASTDGGAGALAELGLVLVDNEGLAVLDGGRGLDRIADLDRRSFRPPPPGGVRLLVDVDAPLVGPRGSAATFGPQKGATDSDVEVLERGLSHLARVMGPSFADVPGAGAAGGVAFGFMAAWAASVVAGAAAIAQLTGLDSALATSDVLITGEGRFDETSLRGKAVGYALAHRRQAARAFVIAGDIDQRPGVVPAGIVGIRLIDLAGSRESALGDSQRWLRRAGREAALRVSGDTPFEVSSRPPGMSPDWARHR